MTKYLIKWDSGSGESHKVEEFETEKAAEDCAYQEAHEEFESQVSYGAEILDEENAADYGYEDELED